MSELINVKTSELVGAALDWAVGSALDLPVHVFDQDEPYAYVALPQYAGTAFRPSTDWGHGGPLFDSHIWRVDKVFAPSGDYVMWNYGVPTIESRGPTKLIAACRAIVLQEIGENIQVPAELCGGDQVKSEKTNCPSTPSSATAGSIRRGQISTGSDKQKHYIKIEFDFANYDDLKRAEAAIEKLRYEK